MPARRARSRRWPPEPPIDLHSGFVEAMVVYRRNRLTPKSAPEVWDRLREDFDRAYRRGRLSDNEADDLLNRWLDEVYGWTRAGREGKIRFRVHEPEPGSRR